MKGKEEICFKLFSYLKKFLTCIVASGSPSFTKRVFFFSHPSQTLRQLTLPHHIEMNEGLSCKQLNKKSKRGTDSCWLKMIEKCLTDSFEIRQRNDNNHKNKHGRHRDNQTDMLETDRQTRRPWFCWKLRDRKSCVLSVLSVCLTSVPFLLTFSERKLNSLFLSMPFIGDCLFHVNHCSRESKAKIDGNKAIRFAVKLKAKHTLETLSVNENCKVTQLNLSTQINWKMKVSKHDHGGTWKGWSSFSHALLVLLDDARRRFAKSKS